MFCITRIIVLGIVAFMLTEYRSVAGGLTYTTRTTQHMFPFGDENGDEKILVDNLPFTKDLDDKIIINRAKFDQLEIFAEGRIELHSKFISLPFSPVLSPYELLYSRVTSGHVWYRDTNAASELQEVNERLQADINVDFSPRRLKVITWQFQDVEAKYPECLPENRADNEQFCDCLDNWPISGTAPHLARECLFLISYNWSHDVCQCIPFNADYRYCACDDGSGHRSFDTRNYCICEARGGSVTASQCIATTHNAFFGSYGGGYLSPVEGCDFCGCSAGSRLGFCHCTHIDRYRAMGMMKCYLLFTAGQGDCFFIISYSPMCSLALTCESGGSNAPVECKCLLPATLTAAELIECLLEIHNHSHIWLCDDLVIKDSNPLLQTYCTCIVNKENVLDDEIYCKCLAHSIATSGDICQCLSAQGHSFNGITGCGSSKRFALPFQATEDQTEAVAQVRQLHVRDAVTYMNTFQVVIAHGRRDTYVYFTYHKLEYSDRNIATRVGSISLDTSAFSGYEHPYPQDMFLLHFLLWDSNTGTDGRWLYKVNNHEVWEPQWTPTNSSTKY